MTTREVQDRLKAPDFRPFEFVMNNGSRFKIVHPEFAILTEAYTIHLYRQSERDEALASSRYDVLSVRNISSIEPLEMQAK